MSALLEPMDPAARPRIILIGDSITQQSFSYDGWGAGLQDYYSRCADVINRGFSGYNSRWIADLLPRILPVEEPQNTNIIFATILLGANDSVAPGTAQNVPVDEFKRNIARMIRYLRDISPHVRLILITPPTVDHNQWPTRHESQVVEYARAMRELSSELSAQLVDFWTEDGTCSIEVGDLHDGLHCNSSGNRKIFAGIKQVIRSQCPDISPEDNPDGSRAMKLHFPHHSQLGGKTATETSEIIEEWKW